MLIYKVFRADEMAAFLSAGTTRGAPVDVADGFVHLSAGDQLGGTLAKHFAADRDLTLLALESETLGDALVWEVSRGGALFPHLYRELRIEDVVWHKPLPVDEDSRFEPIWL